MTSRQSFAIALASTLTVACSDTFEAIPYPDPSGLPHALIGSSRNDLWLMIHTTLHHFDGATWSEAGSRGDLLGMEDGLMGSPIGSAGPGRVYGTFSDEVFVLSRDGTREPISLPADNYGGKRSFAFGHELVVYFNEKVDGGKGPLQLWRVDGTTTTRLPDPPAADQVTVAHASNDDVWLVLERGPDSPPLHRLAHFDGASWKEYEIDAVPWAPVHRFGSRWFQFFPSEIRSLPVFGSESREFREADVVVIDDGKAERTVIAPPSEENYSTLTWTEDTDGTPLAIAIEDSCDIVGHRYVGGELVDGRVLVSRGYADCAFPSQIRIAHIATLGDGALVFLENWFNADGSKEYVQLRVGRP